MWTGFIPLVIFLGEFALKLVVLSWVLIRRKRKPSVNLAWTMIILLIPFLGIIAYLLVGEVRLGRRRVKHYEEICDRLETARLESTTAPSSHPNVPERFSQIAYLAEAVGGSIVRGNNHLTLLNDTDAFMDAVLEDIEGAQEHCHLLFYIYLDDGNGRRVADALLRAAKRGVVCRLMVDSVGSRDLLQSNLWTRMQQGGVQCVEMLPARIIRALFKRLDLRNHRKIVVIDNEIAYMGSQNIADAAFAPKRRFAPWIDMMVRATGPITRDLQGIFIQDWYMDSSESLDALLRAPIPESTEGAISQVIGTGPTSFNEAMRQLIHSSLHVAREELILTTPYFVPDDATMIAVETAARRGVHTTLIVPRRNDSPLVAAASRSHYESLLSAGAEILEYTGGLLHAKTMTIDRDLALVSTANLDRRSFEINFEVSVVVYDTDFASQLRFLQKSYAQNSIAVSHSQWLRRPPLHKLAQNAAGMLSPLL